MRKLISLFVMLLTLYTSAIGCGPQNCDSDYDCDDNAFCNYAGECENFDEDFQKIDDFQDADDSLGETAGEPE